MDQASTEEGSEIIPRITQEQEPSRSKTPSVHQQQTPLRTQHSPTEERNKPPTPWYSPPKLPKKSTHQFHWSPHQSPIKSTSLQSKNNEEEKFTCSNHSDDSPTTTQRKRVWRVTNFVDEIWKEKGFETSYDETLINSWVNPTRGILDADYVPHITYAQPPSHGYWDIPISSNSKYFLVF